jgi:hypothetical protein
MATYKDVQDHYDHEAVAPYISREDIVTVWSLGHYDGPGSGLVKYKDKWYLALCEDMMVDERIFWLVDPGEERMKELLTWAEDRFAAYGNCRWTPDGKDDCDENRGTLGKYGSPGYDERRTEWESTHKHPMAPRDAEPNDIVVGYFCNWRER